MLTLREVSKSFMAGTADTVRALDRVNLVLQPGDFVTVIGSNGAGKSTLLNVIAGLVPPSAGRIELDGADITLAPVHRRSALIGRVAQNPLESTCASMSIAENLAMAARRGSARGLRRAVTATRAEAFRRRLASVGLGLEQRIDARVGTLSGGQRQAIALLMATSAAPRLLLLDEHLANLDPRTAGLVMALTGRLVAEAALTTLMVTHNLAEAIRWGDRLIMMHEGRIAFEVRGADKAALSVGELIDRFHAAVGAELVEDRVLLNGTANHANHANVWPPP
jgi:putative ABC transport system ATP-binding protein